MASIYLALAFNRLADDPRPRAIQILTGRHPNSKGYALPLEELA